MDDAQQSGTARPDTSKNGMMKKNQLQVKDESVRDRSRNILGRLGKKPVDETETSPLQSDKPEK